MKKLLLTVVLLTLTAAFCSCGKSEENKEIAVPILETKRTEYRTATAEITDISQKYYQNGSYAYPYYEFVSFKASGQIESIDVKSGDDVKKGDLLCTLNSDQVSDQLDEKKIYLEQAKKTLSTLQKNKGSAREIQMAQIELDIQQLEYDHLKDSLDDYKVYAPCDGIFNIAQTQGADGHKGKELNVYTWVNKGEMFGYSMNKSQMYLCCEVYDNPLNNVNFGTKVQLEQGATKCNGTVTDIIYNANGDYSTYIYVITPQEKSGLFDFGDVQVCFDVYSRLDTVVVPSKAVKIIGDRKFVNLFIDGVKVEQDVETGIEDGENIEILSGLVGGEELILN